MLYIEMVELFIPNVRCQTYNQQDSLFLSFSFYEKVNDIIFYLSNLYPWSRDSARMVFVDVARQPTMAAQKPNMLKLSSVMEVSRIPPTIGIKEAQMRHSKYFLQTNH